MSLTQNSVAQVNDEQQHRSGRGFPIRCPTPETLYLASRGWSIGAGSFATLAVDMPVCWF